jgi:hypothetical protein
MRFVKGGTRAAQQYANPKKWRRFACPGKKRGCILAGTRHSHVQEVGSPWVPSATSGQDWRTGSRRRPRRGLFNPGEIDESEPTLIYPRVEKIQAIKPDDTPYEHEFTSGSSTPPFKGSAKAYGLANGDVLITTRTL